MALDLILTVRGLGLAVGGPGLSLMSLALMDDSRMCAILGHLEILMAWPMCVTGPRV